MAESIAAMCERSVIINPGIPELGISPSGGHLGAHPSRKELHVDSYSIGIAEVEEFIAAVPNGRIHIEVVGLRMEYLNPGITLVQNKLDTVFSQAHGVSPRDDLGNGDSILCHIRLGDNWPSPMHRLRRRFVHPDYPPLPVAAWRILREQTNLRLKFIGNVPLKSKYWKTLQSKIPDAELLKSGSVAEDFMILRRHPRVALSPSTFSVSARLLAPAPAVSYVPRYGFLNPMQRPDVDLTIPGERSAGLPIFHWQGTTAQKRLITQGEEWLREVNWLAWT